MSINTETGKVNSISIKPVFQVHTENQRHRKCNTSLFCLLVLGSFYSSTLPASFRTYKSKNNLYRIFLVLSRVGFISLFISSLYDQGMLDHCPSIIFQKWQVFFVDFFFLVCFCFLKFHFIDTQRSGFNTKMTRMVLEMVLFTKKTQSPGMSA